MWIFLTILIATNFLTGVSMFAFFRKRIAEANEALLKYQKLKNELEEIKEIKKTTQSIRAYMNEKREALKNDDNPNSTIAFPSSEILARNLKISIEIVESALSELENAFVVFRDYSNGERFFKRESDR